MKNKILLIISSLTLLILYLLSNYCSIVKCIILLIIILSNLIFIKNNNHKIDFKFKNIICISFITLLLSILTINSMIGYFNKKIVIKNLSNNTITISSIYKNNNKVTLNNKYNENLENDYKIYNKKTKKYSISLKQNQQYILFSNRSKKIEIYVEKNKSNTIIEINNKKINIPHKNLNTTSIKKQLINDEYIININNINNKLDLYIFLKITIMIICNLIVATYIVKFNNNKKYSLNLILIFPYIFEYQSKLFFDVSITIVALFMILLLNIFEKKFVDYKFTKKEQALEFLLSIIITFSFLGSNIINSKINLEILISFSILVLMFNYILKILFYNLNIIFNKDKKNVNKKFILNKFVFFLIVLFTSFMYLYLFYPYILTNDGVMQLQEMMSLKFTNWHPFLSTYFYSLIYQMFNSVSAIIVLRIIIYSILISSILSYCHRKGINRFLLYAIAFFSVFPINGLYLVTFWKDVDFTIAIITLIYLLYLLIFDKKHFDFSLYNYFSLFISMIIIGFFRHNGFIVFIILLIFLSFYAIRKKYILIILNCILLTICALLIKIPLYNYLNVESAPKNFQYATMIHGLQREYVLNKVPDETKKWMEKILTRKQWNDSYNATNIDSILHYSGKDIRNMNFDKSKLFKYYLIQLKIDPFGLVKDRLDGTNILWDMFSNDKIDDYKYHLIYDDLGKEYYSIFGIKFSSKKITVLFQKLILFIANNKLLDMLFFRGGLSFSILSIFVTYNVINKDKRWIFVLFPVLVNIVTLLLVMHHQSFRYVWNVNLSACLIILLWITNKISNNKEC